MVMYHVVVYSGVTGNVYRYNEFIMHAFVTDKSKIPSVLETVQRLLEKHGKDAGVRYYGVEHLPLDDIGEGWFFFMRKVPGSGGKQCDLVLVESSGRVDLSRISEFKKHRLTVDFDYQYEPDEKPVYVFEVLEKLKRVNVVKKYAFYQTARGFHVRAELARPLDFSDKLGLRRQLHDDPERIKYDIYFKYIGYDGLADVLFNEKYWRVGEQWEHYVETPLTVATVNLNKVLSKLGMYIRSNLNHDGYYSYDVKLATRNLDTPEFSVRDGVLTFRKPADPDAAWTMVRSLLENPVKYVRDHILNSSKSIEEAVVKAYCAVYWKACEAFNRGARVLYDKESNTVLVYLPSTLSKFAEALVGKDGSIVRYIERLLNVKVKITYDRQQPVIDVNFQSFLIASR